MYRLGVAPIFGARVGAAFIFEFMAVVIVKWPWSLFSGYQKGGVGQERFVVGSVCGLGSSWIWLEWFCLSRSWTWYKVF